MDGILLASSKYRTRPLVNEELAGDWSQSETSKYFEWIINDLTLRHFPWAYTCDFCVAFGLLHRVSGLFAASELPLGDCPLCKQDTWPSYLHVRECRKYLKLWSYRVKAKKRFFFWINVRAVIITLYFVSKRADTCVLPGFPYYIT